MKSILRMSFLILMILGLIGCSGEKNVEVDELESSLNAELVEMGEKTVKSSCITCHGVDLKGDMGPSLHKLTLTKEQMIEVLVKGRGSMPPSTASGKEEAVAEYLSSLK